MKLCVYCGSSVGNSDVYSQAARQLGEAIVQHRADLVYGGANLGLMKIVADTVIAGGGHVTGVIPDLLARERAHPGLSKLYIVESMHARKTKMFELSDAFVALPGGYGTLEEIAEQLTWAQLGINPHPCGLLNINGYYDHLVRFLNNAVVAGFIKPIHRDMLVFADTPDDLFTQFSQYTAPVATK